MSDVYQGMPNAVRVGCYEFEVRVGSYEDHEQEGSYGHMNSFQQRISLRPGLSAHKAANTFIHEVIHAIHWVYGLLRHPDEPQPSEEEFTMLTANGLCAFWQDNPAAVAWWQKNLPIKAAKPVVRQAAKK